MFATNVLASSVFVTNMFATRGHAPPCVRNEHIAVSRAARCMGPGCEHVACEHVACEHVGCEHLVANVLVASVLVANNYIYMYIYIYI